MKQLLQRLDTGETVLAEVPVPYAGGPTLVIETRASVISAGTERMLVDFGRANLLQKARSQPDRVRDVLNKMRTDGVGATLEAVRAKLDVPIPLGYCNAGIVKDAGPAAGDFRRGDRVVTNGSHAERVRVPHTLAARIPEGVSFQAAAFTPLASIGLQGIRLAAPTLGETVVVYGLGLIGLLTVQLLRANGCRVIGIDRDPARLALAEAFGALPLNGAEGDVSARVRAETAGVGADAVLLTLASTSNDPVRDAASMSRKRGRIVLVGVTGLELSRADFYEKEISFQVSCSYGPGRYDPSYEDAGRDYPVGFVRWTEQRNFQAVLEMLALGSLDVEPLISHRFSFENAPEAYELLTSGEPSLGIVLEYAGHDASDEEVRTVRLREPSRSAEPAAPVVSFIGAGNYASRILVPAFRDAGARLRSVATSAGTTGGHVGRKYGFEEATTDTSRLFDDPDTNVVVVATPHDSHARFAVRALGAGRHVFVEKPLAITREELDEVEAAYHAAGGDGRGPLLMVGFNRRFAPHVIRARTLLSTVRGPKAFIMTVNAGAIPSTHWIQDVQRGGGRIVGEGCHFVDLLRHLADAPITEWSIVPLKENGRAVDDVSSFTLRFADGSHGTVHYLANGNKAFPKERLEVFAGGRVLQIDNYRRLRTYGWKAARGDWTMRQDKGNAACAAAFVDAVRRGLSAPIPFAEVMEVSRVSVALAEAARAG